jgi:hypothetical protein
MTGNDGGLQNPASPLCYPNQPGYKNYRLNFIKLEQFKLIYLNCFIIDRIFRATPPFPTHMWVPASAGTCGLQPAPT